uniref:Uncharacterized protein n=1 Tax=Romanomermis culicivorax TaxID=13658 RepID=A0A915J9N6_ROMCU
MLKAVNVKNFGTIFYSHSLMDSIKNNAFGSTLSVADFMPPPNGNVLPLHDPSLFGVHHPPPPASHHHILDGRQPQMSPIYAPAVSGVAHHHPHPQFFLNPHQSALPLQTNLSEWYVCQPMAAATAVTGHHAPQPVNHAVSNTLMMVQFYNGPTSNNKRKISVSLTFFGRNFYLIRILKD